MLQTFYPGEYVKSAYGIDFDRLYREGYRGIIFDIDNTLVPHGAPADARARKLFAHLRELGFECCLLSNNKEPRVRMFNKNIGAHYICSAHKPWTKNYRRAMQIMNTELDNTFYVGDQIFTDVWGANLLGMRTFLVMPIDPHEEIQIVLKRYPEKVVLFFYRRWLKRRKEASNTKHNKGGKS